MRKVLMIAVTCGLGLAACTQQAEESSGDPEASDRQQAGEEAKGGRIPANFAETAWLARASDGTRFVTHFDADGTYRDIRNGEFLQSGNWTYADGPSGKQICLEPDVENSVKMCWQPDKMDGDTMIATGAGDRRIELQRFAYVAPETEDGDTAE